MSDDERDVEERLRAALSPDSPVDLAEVLRLVLADVVRIRGAALRRGDPDVHFNTKEETP